VPRVDPDDDSIERWVVYRYAFDAARHERRHQVVAAFDNEGEFLRLIDEVTEMLRIRKADGAAEEVEHVTGRHVRPGYRAEQQARRLEWKRITRRRGRS
jgi:hypothetical protein